MSSSAHELSELLYKSQNSRDGETKGEMKKMTIQRVTGTGNSGIKKYRIYTHLPYNEVLVNNRLHI